MRKAEAGHLIGFVLVLVAVPWALAQAMWDTAAWLVGFDILLNGLPVALQRYNRALLMDLIESTSGRNETAEEV